MNDSNAAYEKKSPRPYILGFCFLWGLILGFVIYLKTESYAQKEKTEQAIKQQQLQDQKKLEEKKNAEKITKTPDFSKIKKNQVSPVDIDQMTKPVDVNNLIFEEKKNQSLRKPPEPQRLTLNSKWGLTGMSTYRPIKPVKLVKPAPKVNFNPPKPAGRTKKPVNINDVELPELSD